MGRVVSKADYTFNKTAKTITFSSRYTGIELGQIQLITNVTNSTIIYQFNKVGFGGTLVGLVLTLVYDTTGAGFNNSDDLMIVVAETQDNTQIYSGTLTTTGATSGVLTDDLQTISIQISGTWEGVVVVEGSNDNSFYIPLMVYPINDVSLVDNINENGIYNLTTSTRYVRLNVKQLQTGSVIALMHGRTIAGPNAANVLSMAMDRTQNMPLNVQEVNLTKKDINNAIVLSDNAGPYYFSGGVLDQNVPHMQLDTTGYLTAVIQTGVINSSIRLQGSQNGTSWNELYTFNTSVGIAGPITSAMNLSNTIYIAPIHTKFIRFIPNATTSGTNTFTVYLKQQAPNYLGLYGQSVSVNNTAAVNISQINGGSVFQAQIGNSTGGTSVNNGLIVGSFQSPGSTTVNYPIMVGGRQAPATGYLSGIVRTMLMDPAGRVLIGASDQTKSTTVETPLQTISSNFQNGASLSVTDLSQFEGQNHTELLAQILLEMRITNRYLAELPRQLNAGQNNLDEPEAFRQDQTFFNL